MPGTVNVNTALPLNEPLQDADLKAQNTLCSEIAQASLENIKGPSQSPKQLDVRYLPGYKRQKKPARWEAISKQLSLTPPKNGASIIDYGSDRGAFSVASAAMFPQAHVFSFENDCMPQVVAKTHPKRDFESSIQTHQNQLKHYNITNNTILNRKVQAKDFEKFNENGVHFDVQYCLSFFHWLHLNSPEAFDKGFSEHVKNANTSYFEMLTHVKKWYQGESSHIDVMKRALKNYGVNASIKKIGPAIGARIIYRIDLETPKQSTPISKLASRIQALDAMR